MTNVQSVIFAAVTLQIMSPVIHGGYRDDARTLLTDEIRNDAQSFVVRVSVDRSDQTYRIGDTMTVDVASSEDGFLYLLQLQADGKIVTLFPNQFDRRNAITAGQVVTVGGPDSPFRMRIGDPLGTETLKAIVSKKRLSLKELQNKFKSIGTEINPVSLRRVYVEELKPDPDTWAEGQIEITTVSADHDFSERKQRRIGLCVGINRFAAVEISNLRACVRDAHTVAGALRQQCDFDEVRTLIDGDASRDNIEIAICQWLRDSTTPEDEIVIYWSGHGARCPDDNGDELDDFDEVLITADSRVVAGSVSPSTAVTDDAFGRWIQELSGRRVVIILDTCHAGGIATGKGANAKGLLGQSGEVAGWSFLKTEMVRARDVGQRNVAVLSSSTAQEVSFERTQGDLSVMTHFLIEALATVPTGTSLSGIHGYLRPRVDRYVGEALPGLRQTPQLDDQLAEPFCLKPVRKAE